MTSVTPVILCGGSGTRLWPLSRSGFPKQFLVLSGGDSKLSLFQEAIERINAITNQDIDLGPTLIVTNEEHRFLALDQLRELPSIKATLLLEPIGRNTAPALTLAAFQARDGGPNTELDPILVITPADQTVQNTAAFVKALQECIAVVNADQSKKTIAILGITPTAPETGYGYIERMQEQGAHHEYTVAKFVEKPDSKTAQSYLADGNYLWNSGMFVLRASTWLAALKEFRSDIFGASETAWQGKSMDQSGEVSFVRPDKDLFTSIPSESIDYAVIEKCPGTPKREFLYVEDMAEASVFVMDLDKAIYDQHTSPMQSHINVGFGEDVTIAQLAHAVAATTGYAGKIDFDASKPDGAPRKWMDSSRLNTLGWKAKIGLNAGLARAYSDFLQHTAEKIT
ncbi:NAD-dependent epimerase/dehydratase family protein [Polynucleobacter paneuropaeus]|nr:NAD-dependent epimerase/dehydratase family protein [Polynucleobacter paneuropaeus]